MYYHSFVVFVQNLQKIIIHIFIKVEFILMNLFNVINVMKKQCYLMNNQEIN